MKKYILLILFISVVLSISTILSNAIGKKVIYTNSISMPVSSTPFVPEPSTPYTLEEVKKHAVETDCWVAIMGSVYDMTKFVDMHPGKKAILKGCGTDASVLFNSEDNHTPTRRAVLKGYKIGILVDNKKE